MARVFNIFNGIGIHRIAGVGEKAKGGALKRVSLKAMCMKPILRLIFHTPLKCGGLFSLKALIPSIRSLVV